MKKFHVSTGVTIVLVAITVSIVILIVLSLSPKDGSSSSDSPPGGQAVTQGGGGPPGQTGPQSGAQPGGRPQQQPGQQRSTAQNRAATVVRATAVSRGTIENSLITNGDILVSSQVNIYPATSGRLTEVRVQVGDVVRRNQTVALVDPSRPGEMYNASPVVSSVNGTVVQVPVSVGDQVSTATLIIAVGDLSKLQIEIAVPERYAVVTRQAMPAKVVLEALPGEVFPARITEIDPVLDPASRTLRVHLSFEQQDARIRAGMFATVSLVVGSHENVLVIPRNAVIHSYNTWIVFVVNAQNTAERREITVDMENEELIEVTSGLDEGELVVTAGQNFLTHGDLIRVVEE
ncbi:MAG: efflux RND transporter periplasmic adaptor subunit [Treponema sp.]|jgi:multidrug efflux pump subunit AcrA (membrane-fusion protein)|nr:efflux RND transporter periplasmic adaptor subunit [Treponema sp.]